MCPAGALCEAEGHRVVSVTAASSGKPLMLSLYVSALHFIQFLALQEQSVKQKAKWKYLQKYWHKGAFFQDNADDARGTAGAVTGVACYSIFYKYLLNFQVYARFCSSLRVL
jgi:hypothetical protein